MRTIIITVFYLILIPFWLQANNAELSMNKKYGITKMKYNMNNSVPITGNVDTLTPFNHKSGYDNRIVLSENFPEEVCDVMYWQDRALFMEVMKPNQALLKEMCRPSKILDSYLTYLYWKHIFIKIDPATAPGGLNIADPFGYLLFKVKHEDPVNLAAFVLFLIMTINVPAFGWHIGSYIRGRDIRRRNP